MSLASAWLCGPSVDLSPEPTAATTGKVALFGTCYGNYNEPGPGEDLMTVFEHNGIPVMLARDVQPTRLERATQKIHDLLELRTGAKTALIAYAGSVHLAMPLTVDPNIINMFSQALTPDIMPIDGDAAAEGSTTSPLDA